MKSKSRHKMHIKILKQLVDKTDYFVGHVWNEYGRSIHGCINWDGEQVFVRYGDHCNTWYTPWLGHSDANKVHFALMPRKNTRFGIVLVGWNELKWFVRDEIAKKERNEKETV